MLIIGIILIIIDIIKTNFKNATQKEKIIYRYIPRSFSEEQEEPVYATDVFRTMFKDDSPWVKSVTELDIKKNDEIYAFFSKQQDALEKSQTFISQA